MSQHFALLTAHNREGLADFAASLGHLGFSFVASRGTAQFLREHQLPVEDVEAITGYPPLVGKQGIKLIHPKIFGGILADPTIPEHLHDMETHGIHRFEIVVCNFYPFEETITKNAFSHEEALFNLDIGGPAMVRCAAKNYANVIIIVDPTDYPQVLRELEHTDSVSKATRQALAVKAFDYTKRYDELILEYLKATFKEHGS